MTADPFRNPCQRIQADWDARRRNPPLTVARIRATEDDDELLILLGRELNRHLTSVHARNAAEKMRAMPPGLAAMAAAFAFESLMPPEPILDSGLFGAYFMNTDDWSGHPRTLAALRELGADEHARLFAEGLTLMSPLAGAIANRDRLLKDGAWLVRQGVRETLDRLDEAWHDLNERDPDGIAGRWPAYARRHPERCVGDSPASRARLDEPPPPPPSPEIEAALAEARRPRWQPPPERPPPLTVAAIAAAAHDDELFWRLSEEIKRRCPGGYESDLLGLVDGLPRGLRAMALSHPLDVSATLDGLAWHFLNWPDLALNHAILGALRELEARPYDDLFAEVIEIMTPHLAEIRELGPEISLGAWLDSVGVRAKVTPMEDAWYAANRDHPDALLGFWAPYARRYSDRCV